jgi:hypothetical protein
MPSDLFLGKQQGVPSVAGCAPTYPPSMSSSGEAEAMDVSAEHRGTPTSIALKSRAQRILLQLGNLMP